MRIKTKMTLKELMKPSIITCGKCSGKLHIFPIKIPLGKNKFEIKTINICPKCSF